MIACPFFFSVILGWGLLRTIQWKLSSYMPSRFIFRLENVTTIAICTASSGSTGQSVAIDIFKICLFSSDQKSIFTFIIQVLFFFFWLNSYLHMVLGQNIFDKVLFTGKPLEYLKNPIFLYTLALLCWSIHSSFSLYSFLKKYIDSYLY